MDNELTFGCLASSNALLLLSEDIGVGDGTLLLRHVSFGEVTEGRVIRFG